MEVPELTLEQIGSIFERHGFDIPARAKKIHIGFLNHVYDVNDRYILKTGKWTESEPLLKKELYANAMLKNHVPVPLVLANGISKTDIPRSYIIFKKIPGDNLYMCWHTLSDDERRAIIKELVRYLRAINQIPYLDFAHAFGINTQESWQARVIRQLNART